MHAMKKAISVSINSPCAENWNSFTPATEGRFCQNCQKTVADLTKLSDRELLEYLQSRTTPTCARMRHDQLRSYVLPGPATVKPGFGLFKAALTSLLLLLFDRQGYAQVNDSDKIEVVETSSNKIGEVALTQDVWVAVSGKVIDETGFPMPGISIVLQGTTIGTSTDELGVFTFPERVRAGQTLLFSFIGYDTKEYKVKRNTSDQVEIEMTMDGITLMGKLAIDQPYTVETKSLWSKIKSIF
jgi:hypothetical protein